MHFICMCLREALLRGQATKKKYFFLRFPLYMCRLSTSGAGTGLHWTCPWKTARSWRSLGAHSRGAGVIILQVSSLSPFLSFSLSFSLSLTHTHIHILFLKNSQELKVPRGALQGGRSYITGNLSLSLLLFFSYSIFLSLSFHGA